MFKEGTIWRIEHRYVLMWGGKPQPEQWLDSYYYCTGNFKEDSIEVLDVNRFWKDNQITLFERIKKGRHVMGNRCIYEITGSLSFIPLSKIRKLHKVAEIKISEKINGN